MSISLSVDSISVTFVTLQSHFTLLISLPLFCVKINVYFIQFKTVRIVFF